jgi:hypothetical protein
MVQLLKLGVRGPEVKRLQEALNVKLVPSPRLVPDGVYGGLTQTAVTRFQQANWLVVDGQAGACTQACAFGEAYAPILHNIRLQPQYTPMTCWAASTAMMVNSTPQAVFAKTPASMKTDDGGLLNWSETDQALPRGTEYGKIHGLRCNAPMSYMISALRNKLKRAPLMFDMLWDVTEYLTPNAGVPGNFLGSAGHVIVVIGMRGDADETGIGTTIRINDPWKPHVGRQFSVSYARFIARIPGATYRVFERL